MAVKTPFTPDEIVNILSHYDLGVYTRSEAIEQGTVQSNFLLYTSQGNFVLKYYENGSRESVLFEGHLLAYLARHCYPCPSMLKNTHGACIGEYRAKPYAIFNFLDGSPLQYPNNFQMQQLVRKAAELQILTQDYHSPYASYRWHYDQASCRTLARTKASEIDTQSAYDKFSWLNHELTMIDLPHALPRGICHCDFHFSNLLFQDGELVALLDFDDANHTFLQEENRPFNEFGTKDILR
jgi:Ser/Thr protein kinase RdoA (MazF antagonist)